MKWLFYLYIVVVVYLLLAVWSWVPGLSLLEPIGISHGNPIVTFFGLLGLLPAAVILVIGGPDTLRRR